MVAVAQNDLSGQKTEKIDKMVAQMEEQNWDEFEQQCVVADEFAATVAVAVESLPFVAVAPPIADGSFPASTFYFGNNALSEIIFKRLMIPMAIINPGPAYKATKSDAMIPISISISKEEPQRRGEVS